MSEKELTDEGVSLLRYAALLQFMSMTILGPLIGADGERVAREMARRAKKMTVTKKPFIVPAVGSVGQ